MSDLNVALRLRLDNQMKAGAEAAKRDLQALKAEADKLGKTTAAMSPASLRAAQQTRQIETQKAVAIERTSAAYRRQRSEMLAGDLAARRLERARDVRMNREQQRARRNAQMGIGLGPRGPIDWGPTVPAARTREAQRRARLDAMTAGLIGSRAAEVRAARFQQQAGLPGRAALIAPTSVPSVPPSAGPSLATGAGMGVAAQGRAQGFSYARSFMGGLGIGMGVAGVANFAKEALLGAGADEFERDQLRVLGNLSEAQMENYRKTLDRTARLRGVGSKGSLGIFGGLMAGGLTPDEAAGMTDNVAIFAKATRSSMEDASRATVALRNNMKLVDPKHIMAAYDAIAAGGKAGEFEVQDMARHLPSLLAKMEKLGETGGDPFKVAKLIPNKRAADALIAALREAGFMMELLDEMASSAGSTMKDYETATDNAQEAWARFSGSIIERSKEVVGQALPSITEGMNAITRLLDNTDQRAGGLLETLGSVLRFMDSIAAKQLEKLSGNPDQKDILSPLIFGKPVDERTKEAYQEYGRTRRASAGRFRSPLSGREAEDGSMDAYNRLVNSGDMEAILEEAREERRRLREERGLPIRARDKAENDPRYRQIELPHQNSGSADDGTPVPPPRVNTFERMLNGMRNLAPEAEDAMKEFNQSLGRGLDDARIQISAAVSDFKAMLSFSAGPTISPTMLPASAPGGGAAAIPVQHAGSGGSVNVTQNISGSDPRMLARRSQREQNRAINLAMNNALHDTGGFA